MSRTPNVWIIESFNVESGAWYSSWYVVFYSKRAAMLGLKNLKGDTPRFETGRHRVKQYVPQNNQGWKK
jgi:hypothetical protein